MLSSNRSSIKFLEGHSPSKPLGCTIEKIISNNFSEPIAVKCLCKKIHPVWNKIKIEWNNSLDTETLSAIKKGKKYSLVIAEDLF